MSFELNQIFSGEYPPEAAYWCNENQLYHIEEIAADDQGRRRFQIVENPQPTEEELAEQERLRAEAEAEAQRVPDLEDATSIEARLSAMEDALAEMMMEGM